MENYKIEINILKVIEAVKNKDIDLLKLLVDERKRKEIDSTYYSENFEDLLDFIDCIKDNVNIYFELSESDLNDSKYDFAFMRSRINNINYIEFNKDDVFFEFKDKAFKTCQDYYIDINSYTDGLNGEEKPVILRKYIKDNLTIDYEGNIHEYFFDNVEEIYE